MAGWRCGQVAAYRCYQRVYLDETGFDRYLFRPYARSLNPIEKVWANIKRYLRTVLSDYARFDDALLSYFDFN